MTLVGSGTDLYLKGTGQPTNQSIEYEVEGALSGNVSLVTMSNSADPTVGSLPTGMRDFEGHTQCSLSVPGIPATPATLVNNSPAPSMTFTWGAGTNAEDYRIEYTITGLSGTWIPWAVRDASLTRSLSLNTNPGNVYYARVRSENCAGVSSWRNSNSIVT